MIVLVPFPHDYAKPYLTAALKAARGRTTAIRPAEEIKLLKQTIALCGTALNVAPVFSLPPADSPLRAAVERAVRQMQVDGCVCHKDDPVRDAIHLSNMRSDLLQYARRRLATLESRIARKGQTAGQGLRAGNGG